MPSVVVWIDLSADELLRYYRGEAKNVLAVSEDGRTVRFPASLLRTFVPKTACRGGFCWTLTRRPFLGAQRLLDPNPLTVVPSGSRSDRWGSEQP